MLKSTAALTMAATAGAFGLKGCSSPEERAFDPDQLKGRIKQVLVSWTYMSFGAQWSLDELCQAAVNLGCPGIELVGPAEWPTMKKYGLKCALSVNGMPDPPYAKGLNNPLYQRTVIDQTKKRIEECAEAGVPSVIAFTGYKYRNNDRPEEGVISLEEGAEQTVKGLKELALHAEKHGITICMEHLNSRVENDDFRGHPPYQGDDIDYCADIIRKVGSPNVKLLFDIYHIQIMNGDIIARIKEYGTDLIGHVHTAGVPGRTGLGEGQELAYSAIMNALLDIGYEGYVGHEFIKDEDPTEELQKAIRICDV
ncbi:sugar phosphate isomerase/epimerase family protein [Balneolaceae bacterium ANBcel3]|nr:sugar phosphate isomerase/epimerase family protein [Balneolaceae bacterium ANBcel3]